MSEPDPGPSATDYDRLADRYKAGVDQRVWNALYERPATVAMLPEVAGLEVMDAGCGPGWYADLLARRGASVIAVDASPRMAALAHGRLQSRATVHAADMGALGALVAPASLDLIVSSLAIHYVADLDRLFTEWARLVKPGGRLVFSTHHPFYDIERIRQAGYLDPELVEEQWAWLGTVRFYRRPLSAITEPLADAGFLIERLSEPRPGAAFGAARPEDNERLARLPAFLILRARRA